MWVLSTIKACPNYSCSQSYPWHRTIVWLFPELKQLFWLLRASNTSFKCNSLTKSCVWRKQAFWLSFQVTKVSSQSQHVYYVPCLRLPASLNTKHWNKTPSVNVQWLTDNFSSDEQIWPSHSIVSKEGAKPKGWPVTAMQVSGSQAHCQFSLHTWLKGPNHPDSTWVRYSSYSGSLALLLLGQCFRLWRKQCLTDLHQNSLSTLPRALTK